MVQQLKDNRQRMDQLLEEKRFAEILVDKLKQENRNLKRDFEIVTRIIDQYRGEGLDIDLNSILGKSKPCEYGTQTEGELVVGMYSTRTPKSCSISALESRSSRPKPGEEVS